MKRADRYARLKSAIVALLAVFLATGSAADAQLSWGQHIFLMKNLRPGLKTVGMLAGSLSKSDRDAVQRAAVGQGVHIVFGLPSKPSEIASVYRTMIQQHQVQMMWIPASEDQIILQAGFDFLRENTAIDRVGLCVPSAGLVTAGALCAFEKSGDKITVHVNKKIAQIIGASVPTAQDQSVAYVVN